MKITIPGMQELLSAGVHFGHQVRRGNPRMKPFIFGAKEGVHIIDLAQSEEKLKEAAQKAYELGKEGKVMLLVGTKKQDKEIIEKLAQEVGLPYLTERWPGGLLTNFDEMQKNFKKLNGLKDEKEKGTLSRYTKKEQLLITRKLDKFLREFGGVATMSKVPDAIFIVDPVANDTAVKEASRIGVMLLGLSDTNADPNWFDFPVPANDDGIKSIKIISETVVRAYGEGKSHFAKASRDKEEADAKAAEKAKVKVAEVEEDLDAPVAEEAAAIEEVIEKAIVKESDRKVE